MAFLAALAILGCLAGVVNTLTRITWELLYDCESRPQHDTRHNSDD